MTMVVVARLKGQEATAMLKHSLVPTFPGPHPPLDVRKSQRLQPEEESNNTYVGQRMKARENVENKVQTTILSMRWYMSWAEI